jgi:hypothetical protein
MDWNRHRAPGIVWIDENVVASHDSVDPESICLKGLYDAFSVDDWQPQDSQAATVTRLISGSALAGIGNP